MLKIFSVAMSFLFLMVISHQAVIIVHFKLNQKAIEREFCVNKDKPELHCKGNCHLEKELEQSKNNETEKGIHYKNFDLAFIETLEIIFESTKIFDAKEQIIYKNIFVLVPDIEILCPPPLSKFSLLKSMPI